MAGHALVLEYVLDCDPWPGDVDSAAEFLAKFARQRLFACLAKFDCATKRTNAEDFTVVVRKFSRQKL
jgi:hypothetical protein